MKVRYMFDVLSPYSALSTKVLLRYKAAWGMQLELVPVFLGGIMQATGNKPPAMLPARAAFQAKDLERQAKLFRVPMLPTPSNFFSNVARDTIQCQRLLCAALDAGLPAGKVEALLDALTDGMHVVASERSASNDLAVDEAFLRRALERARFDAASAEALLGARGSDAIKKKLADNTKEAVEAGAYGSPTMLITPPVGKGEPFLVFGSDRFEQIAFITGKPYHGPVPPGSKL